MKTAQFFCTILAVAGLAMTLAGCGGNQDTTEEFIPAKVTAGDLSNQRVTAFAEDAQGFMWIGTFRGLNCYNSHKFHQYFCTDKPDDLPDNQINHLMCDSKKRLWVATLWGVAVHNNQDKFTHTPINGGRTYCKQVFEGSDGRIFAIFGSHFGVFDEEKMCFNTVYGQPQEANKNTPANRDYQYGFMDFGRRVWLCDKSGTIDILDSKTFARVDSVVLGVPTVSYCRDAEQNRLWLGTVAGVKVVDISVRRLTELPPALQAVGHVSQQYVSVIHKHNGSMLFASTNGVYLYNANNGEVKHQSDNGFPYEVPLFINAIYTDSHNNLWIGSYDQGFKVVSSQKSFNTNRFLVKALRNKSVYSLAADKNDRLWITTLQGPLYVYDSKSEHITTIDTQSALSSNTNSTDITMAFADRDGDLWLASLFRSTVSHCRYDGTALHEVKSFAIDAPLMISQDKQGNIWVGSGNGRISCISHADASVSSTAIPGASFVAGIQQMPNGQTWAAAMGHPIYSVDIAHSLLGETSLNLQRWNSVLRRSTFIPTDLRCDSFGKLWIGTVGNGLLKYDIATDSLTHMTGLPCTDISSILEDRQGNIWVSSQYGMARYDRTSGAFERFFAADGIGGNQFYDRSACMLSDGTLVFGGTHGVTIFNPLDLHKPGDVPLVFDELKIHNTMVCPADQPDVIDRDLSFAPEVTLNHRQNGFSISFALLNYGGKEHDNYSYKLEGHDKYWIEAGQTNEAYYANLRPGSYTFRVRVASSRGDGTSKEISLPITVKPAPWLSWWAIMAYVLIIAAIARTIYKARQDYLAEREQRRLAERDREQQRRLNRINMSFFSNISHEFRTPLTMISGPVAQLQGSGNINGQERRLLDVVQRNIHRMLRLVNQIMDFHKLDNDTLRLQVEHVDMMVYLRHIIETFVINAEEKGIAMHTTGMEEEFVTWIDTDKLEKIMNNLLSNAMKITPPGVGQIDVDFDVIDASEAQALARAAHQSLPKTLPCMKLVVTDNGPGLPPAELERIFDRYYQLHSQAAGVASGGTGIGLYYSRALAKLHHGCLFAQNRDDDRTGARFTVLLPVGDEAYTDSERVTAQPLIATQPAPATPQPTPAPGDEATDDRPTLLIVDDDSDVVAYLKALLSPHYNVISSFNAEQAYELAAENHPDLILSDVIMPVTDGYDLCRRIKNDLQISHIPVILVTAKATVENQVEGLNTGADAYVTKPFDPKYLLALIKSQLTNRQKARNILSEATETAGIEPDVLSGPDKAFMDELYKLMENELGNPELDITLISTQLHISRTKLFYKIKGLTGSTPAAFFKTYKLNRAAELIAQGNHSMQEIAFRTGFSTQAHFSTSFKKQFGTPPTAYTPTQPRP